MEQVKIGEVFYNVNHCGSMNAMLFIGFIGYSVEEITRVCSVQQDVSHIEYYIDNKYVKTFEGFSYLGSVDDNGYVVTVMLITEENL